MSKAILNTFKKLDTDTSQNKQDNSSFYDAQNLRLITDEALSNGALVNFKGTKAKIDLGNKATKLKGSCEVGNELALLLYRDVEGLVPEGSESITTPDTYKSFSIDSTTDITNKTNYAQVLATTSINVTGPNTNSLHYGIPIKYYNGSSVLGVLGLIDGFDYNFIASVVAEAGYSPSVFTVVVAKSSLVLDGGSYYGINTLSAANVLSIDEYETGTTPYHTQFSIPDEADTYNIIVYPSRFTLVDSNYVLENVVSKVNITPSQLQVLVDEETYTNVESVDDFKDRFVDGFNSLSNTPFILEYINTGAYSSITTTPALNGGMVDGYIYRMHIQASSSLGLPVHVKVSGGTEFEEDFYITSTALGVIEIDLEGSLHSGTHSVIVYAGINDVVTCSVSTINKIVNIAKLIDISTNDPRVYGFNVINTSSSSSVTSAYIYVYDSSDNSIIKQYTVPVHPYGSTPASLDFIDFSGYYGYDLGVNTCPLDVAENVVNVNDFTIYDMESGDIYIYEFDNSSALYYTAIIDLIEYLDYPTTGGLLFKVVNTTKSSTIYSKRITVGETKSIKFNIPADGDTYKIYFNVFYDNKTLTAFELSQFVLTNYILNESNSIGSVIAKITLDETNNLQSVTELYSDVVSVDKLGFDEVDEVEVVGRYENEYSKKIYFTVPGKPLRIFNLATDTLSTAEATTLDIVPNNNGTVVEIDSVITGGNIEVGRIQYACKLFNKYTTETTFSPCSELISLTDDNANTAQEFTGADIETSSNKSVRISIDVTDNPGFSYAHIYSIHYKVKDIPVISLVGEVKLTADVITFIDNGTVLNTITLEEFNSFGGRLISPETLAIKNNILFAANIEELLGTIDEEDIDCRAYRFDGDSPNVSQIFESDGSYYLIQDDGDWQKYTALGVADGAPGTGWSIPITADCINKYNDEFLISNGGSTHPYTYDKCADGTTIGGTGKVISYEIKVENDFTKLVSDGETIVDSDNVNYILKSTSFKQGETYRLGITFFDLKGKPYFNRWIGDVRIPYLSGDNNIIKSKYTYTGVANTEDLEMWGRNIYIEFNVDTSAIAPDILNKISGFQITRVERTTYDKSITGQGYTMGGVVFDYTPKQYMHRCSPAPYNYVNNVAATDKDKYPTMTNFFSPELNINGGVDVGGDYRFKVVKILARPIVRIRTSNAWASTYNDATETISAACRLFYPITEVLASSVTTSKEVASIDTVIVPGLSIDILSLKKLGLTEIAGAGTVNLTASSTDVKFVNRVASPVENSETTGTGPTYTMYGPTCAVASMNFNLYAAYDFNSGDTSGYIYLLDLYKDNASSRYGGNTYTARSLNTYIQSSPFCQILDSCIANGDTYVTVFDTLTSIVDPSEDDGTGDVVYIAPPSVSISRRQIVSLFPLESSVNCSLVNNKPGKYAFNYPSGENLESQYIGLTETTLQGINLYGTKYPDVDDFNKYNTAYSAVNSYPQYVQEPFLFDNTNKQATTIVASEKKSNGEFIDSWSKFLYANMLEVESSYDTIHKLTVLDNKLYFFQENAIGVAAVNDRYVIGNNDASQLALGSGGILERYDYIKYNSGIIKPSHAINTTNGLYYIDHNRKVLDTVMDSQISLSVSKGINSLFRSLYKDKNSNVIIGYDPVYREILFTITNAGIGKTLVFSEATGEFAPRHSAVPELYVNLSNGLYSYIQSNQSLAPTVNYIYKHNVGMFGEVYSEANYSSSSINLEPSYVSLILNTNSTEISVFDNIEFRTEVRQYADDSEYNTSIFGDNDSNDVLKTIDSVLFKNSYQSVNKLIKVKGVDSNYNTSRLIRSWTTAVPLTSNGKRFVDTFMSMTLTFNNIDNKVFKLHDIITYIRPTHK